MTVSVHPDGTGANLARLLAYPLFLASGAAGLMYEVVWTRMLLNTFGAGLYAVSAVLAAFMAGLALGSWALGGISDRLRRPLRLYALLEVGIGICGAAAPFLLARVGLIDAWAYRHWGQDFTILTAFRFGLAFLLMLVPTTLMGATLPVLSRFMVYQRTHMGLHVGALYATNTFGAVIGTFAAGFWLIGWLGLLATEFTAVALNLAVALLALPLSMAIERAPSLSAPGRSPAAFAPDPPADRWTVRWVLATAFCSGAVALAAQVLWSRTLIFTFEYLKNTTYAFSAMLTVFLAGLAIGSALVGLFVDRQRHPLRLYGLLLTLVGISITLSVVVLYTGGDALKLGEPLDPATKADLNWPLAVANIMLQSVGVLGIPTLLLGMAFPVAVRVVAGLGRVGRDVGRLYALNTVGAICGSLLAAFVIIPAFGLTGGLILLGIVEVALGLATLWRSGSARLHLAVMGPLAALLIAMTLLNPLRGHGLQALSSPIDQIKFYAEGPLATVSVLENNLGERTIYVDDVGVAGTDPVLQTDQKSLAHMPMMLLENPKSALTVGFGSGGASYSLQLHDSLQRIDCAEICLTVLDAAPTLGAANHHFFARQVPVAEAEPGMLLARPALSADGSQLYPAATRLDQGMINVIAEQAAEERLHVGDPIEFARADDRYNIILDDARAWLRYTEHKYDFIATDCTDLRYKSNANLYDVEYFEACREHLTEDGIVVVWMPLAGLDREIFKTALRTFHHVFPTMGIFFMANEPTHYILMIGWQDDEIRLDYSLFARRLSEQDVRQDLAELFLDDPVKLLSCFVTASVEGREDALDAYLAGEELNTENHPVIEFRSPMYGYSSKPLIDNLGDLMAARVSPREFLDPATIPPAELARLEAYEEALPHVIAGHAALRNLEVEPATHAYLDALALTPRDLSVRTLLTFPILQKRIRIEPDNPLIHLWLGRALMLQDKLDTAYDLLARAAQLYQARLMREPPPGMTEQERNFDRVRMAEAQRWQSEIWSARRGTQSPAPPPALL